MIKRYIIIGAVVLLLMGVVLFSLTPTSLKVGDAIIISLCAGSGGTVIDISPDIHEANTQITIQATANPGYCFDRWTTSTGGNFADKFSTHTTFTVPKQSATITAHFKPIEDGSPAYYLTVTVGEGGTIPAGLGNRINGFYVQGAKITVPLRSMQGYVFDRWTSSNGGYFDDEYSLETAFTMPGNSVTITATFKPKPLFQKSG